MHIWYIADLLPPAQGLFNQDWYPSPKRGSGSQPIFFCLLPDQQGRVLLSPSEKCNISQMRVLTRELASSAIEPRTVPKYGYEKATKAQMTLLNLTASSLQEKFH